MMALNYKRQKGLIHTPLAFFVVLWMLTTIALFVIITINSSVVADTYNNKQERKRFAEKGAQIDERLHQIQSLTGFYSKERQEIATTDDIAISISTLMENLNTINKDENAPGTRVAYGLTKLDYSPDIEEDKLIWRDYPLNVEKVLGAFRHRIIQLQNTKSVLNKQLKDVQQDISAKKDERRVVVQQLQSKSQALANQLSDTRKKYRERIKNVKQGQTDALTAIKQTEAEIKTLNSDIKKAGNKFSNELNQKKNAIRRLQAAKYGRTTYAEFVKQRKFDPNDEKVDGEIVFADPSSRTVYISLGKNRGVSRGLKFEVYRPSKKGVREYKGSIEVTKVKNDVSMATLISSNSGDPIVAEDQIINPFYDSDRDINVVFAGKFTKYSNEHTSDFLEKIGAKISSKISAKTNFVIVANNKGNEHKNYTQAIRFGIPLMSEDDLFKYIGD